MDNDIQAAVKAAYAELTSDDKPEVAAAAPAVSSEAEATVVTPAPAAVDKPVDPTEEEKVAAKAKDGEDEAARVARLETEGREANGRFKRKADADKGAVDKGAAAKDSDKPLVPPAHWDPEAKAAFVQAPKALQQQALKREEQINEARKEWSGKAEDYNRIHKVISPKINDWQAAGITPDVAIGRLLAFENILKTDPVGGTVRILSNFARGNEMEVITRIAAANGFTLTKTGTQAGSDQGNAPAQDEATARELKLMRDELADIKRKEAERMTAATQADDVRIRSELDAVANDPKNLYFKNLIPEIRAILSIGDTAGDARPIPVRTQEAYDKAVWANEGTRKLVQEQQERDRTETARKAEADRVAAAKRAAVSINGGAPGDGKLEQQRPSSSNSIADAVRAAYAEVTSARA